MLKTIKVVASVITNADKTEFFATARGYGEQKGKWEFPGGKIEQGETEEEALYREIKEELDVELFVEEKICTIEYDYPSFHLSMSCFWCMIKNGTITLKEAQDAKWLKREELDSVEWLPADVFLVEQIKKTC